MLENHNEMPSTTLWHKIKERSHMRQIKVAYDFFYWNKTVWFSDSFLGLVGKMKCQL